MQDVKQLSKMAVKLDRIFETTNPKCRIKLARLFKRAISLEKKLVAAMGKLMPLLDDKEVRDTCRKQMSWMEERMTRRHGRITQNPVPRTERRLYARSV